MKNFKKCLILLLSVLFITGFTTGCSNSSNLNKTNAAASKAANTQTQNTITTTSAAQSNNISTYFTRANGHPETALINVINSSKSTLNIAIYSITKYDIVDAIANAKKRGVDVKIITDKECSSSSSQSKELSYLLKYNIPIKINSHSGLMHMKVTIADSSTVTVGSYNYTNNASSENDEVLCVIKNNDTATTFQNEFNSMWNDNSNYQSYTASTSLSSNSSNNNSEYNNSNQNYSSNSNKKSYKSKKRSSKYNK